MQMQATINNSSYVLMAKAAAFDLAALTLPLVSARSRAQTTSLSD
jgi:hypothetical protein